MKIVQLNYWQYSKLPVEFANRVLLVESQTYGQLEDFVYHVACSEATAKEMAVGRIIPDKGRTIGFWQNLAGQGVWRRNQAAMQGFNAKLVKILKDAEQSSNTKGSDTATWKEIVELCDFNDEFIQNLGVNESTTVSKKKTIKTK